MVVGHLQFSYDVSLTQERRHLHIELRLALENTVFGNEREVLGYPLTILVVDTSKRNALVVSHYIDNSELVIAIVLKGIGRSVSFVFVTSVQPADERDIESLWLSASTSTSVLRREDWCGLFLSVDHNVNLVGQSLSDKLSLLVGRAELKQATGLVGRK